MKTYNNFSDFFDNVINGKWIIPNEIFASITSCCNVEDKFAINELCKDAYYGNWNNAISANNISSIEVSLFNDINDVDSIRARNKISAGESIVCVKSNKVLKIFIEKEYLKNEDFEQSLNVVVCKALHGKFETTDRVCIEYYSTNKFSFKDFFAMLMKVCEMLNKKVKKVKVENREEIFKAYKNKIVNDPISNKDKTLAFCQVAYRFIVKSDIKSIFKNYEIGKLFDMIISMNNMVGMFKGVLNGNKSMNASNFDMSAISNMMAMFGNLKNDVGGNSTNLGSNQNIDLSNIMATFMNSGINGK